MTLLKAQLFFNIVPIFNLLPPLNKSMHYCPVKFTLLPLRSSAHSILLRLVLTGCLPKGQTVKNLMVWDQEYRWVQQHCPSKFFSGLTDLCTGMRTGITMEYQHFRQLPCRINSTDLLLFQYSGQTSLLSPEPKIHKWHTHFIQKTRAMVFPCCQSSLEMIIPWSIIKFCSTCFSFFIPSYPPWNSSYNDSYFTYTLSKRSWIKVGFKP